MFGLSWGSFILRVGLPIFLAGAAWWWVNGVLADREALGYGRGRQEVQAQWDAEKVQRAELARQAAEARAAKQDADRKQEQEDRDAQAQRDAERDAALAAAQVAGAALSERLRIALNALRADASRGGAVPEDRSDAGGAAATAEAALRDLGRCAAEYESVAREAAALASQTIDLQAWARRAQAICGQVTQP